MLTKSKSIFQIRIPLNWSEANLPHLSNYSIEIHSSVVYVFALDDVQDTSTSVLSENSLWCIVAPHTTSASMKHTGQ